MKRGIFFLFSSILFFSCSSIPEPVDQSSTLFIGKIVLAAKGYEGYGHVSVNGVHKMGINITIQNIKSGETYGLISGKTGIFCSAEIPAGEYIILKYFYQYNSERAYAEIYASPGEIFVFQINPGRVNNVGVIYWFADSRKGVTLQFNMDYPLVREEFGKSYKNSLWLNYNWVNIPLNKQGNPAGFPITHFTGQPGEDVVL